MPLLDDPWLPAPDLETGLIGAWRPAIPVEVLRHAGTTLDPLPNVECLWVADAEGTDPGKAGFRYNFASGLEGAPASIEQALSTEFSGAYVVEPGDRLVVRATLPDASTEFLFDGFAVDFGLGLDPSSEETPIGCVGVAWRLWDTPIRGALMRDSTDPIAGADVETHLMAHFNPGGTPNCVPEDEAAMAGELVDEVDSRYPIFIDTRIPLDSAHRTNWTLPRALRYLLYRENPDEEFVINPDGATLDALLVSPEGDPIAVPDLPVTGKDLPSTIYQLVREVGFGMKFELGTGDDGLPRTDLVIFAQQGGDTKHLYLAARGTDFDPTLFNFDGAGLSRDVSEVVNAWRVRGAPDRYEASFVLAPGFPMTSTDSSAANLHLYKVNDEDFDATNGDKYRLFVFDETGEGHYDAGTDAKIEEVVSLDDVLGAPDGTTGDPAYVPRRRPPIGDLVTLDGKGLPREASLWVSKDYAGDRPGIWDGTGTWQKVVSSTWKLLRDRIGVEVTDSSPNSWLIDSTPASGAPFPDGKVNLVEALATTGAANLWLRLTCVIEADVCVEGFSGRTDSSPLPQSIERLVDASDRYRKETVHYPSEHNPPPTDGSTPADLVERDDSELALAEASSIRKATEAGVLGGSVSIPRLTGYYKLGDRVASIEGRGLGLRTDGGTGDPIYPVVVARRFDLAGERQSVAIELSDAGTDRARYSRQTRRRSRGI